MAPSSAGTPPELPPRPPAAAPNELPPLDDAPALPPRAQPDDAPPPPPPPTRTTTKLPHTRIGAAWFGIWAGVLVVILLIIFIAQNTASVRINFLWMNGQFPVALALLIAGVAGAIVAMAVAAARILQLRRMVSRRQS
ncbi:LapA family protein [Paractinoplanes ovalisporus]|uniref:LapA family protein n=1 Tax=Paractinoplanes ovalisporus TaxID=2810368 RepID=UPI0034DB203C